MLKLSATWMELMPHWALGIEELALILQVLFASAAVIVQFSPVSMFVRLKSWPAVLDRVVQSTASEAVRVQSRTSESESSASLEIAK